MSFISGQFILFFLVTFSLFLALPARFRQPMLLAASYLFYATWSIPFIAVIIVTTSTDYWISRYISGDISQKKRRAALFAGIVINLVMLGFFKYVNFLLGNINSLYSLLHGHSPLPDSFSIILPLGISFYTFEAISYMVDVYRGREPARNWLDYNFYIMYFPHLISGPIIRFCEMAPQYREALELPSLERFNKGTELMVLGFMFKILIADQVAGLSDMMFNAPQTVTSLGAWLGALAFTVQIYFDFMGYTHIARGASLFFNIELPINFDHPYIAGNISEFWQRWHISLSRWIRDYLYIPLGGSRCSLPRTVWNLFFTMLLAGAWHGAGWTYILWGGYHGLLLGINHLIREARKRFSAPSTGSITATTKDDMFVKQGAHASRSTSWGYHLLTVAVTFVLVVVGWVLFRAPNLPVALTMLQHMFSPTLLTDITGLLRSGHLTQLMQVLALLVICLIGPAMIRLREKLFEPMPLPLKTATVSFMLILCWLFTAQSAHPFIYFQF